MIKAIEPRDYWTLVLLAGCRRYKDFAAFFAIETVDFEKSVANKIESDDIHEFPVLTHHQRFAPL